MFRTIQSAFTWGTLSALAIGALGFTASNADAAVFYGIEQVTASLYRIDTSVSSGPVYTKLTQNNPYYLNSAGTSSTSSPNLRGLGMDDAGNLYSASNSNWATFKMTVSGNTFTPIYYGSPGNSSSGSTADGSYMYVGTGTSVRRAVYNGTSTTFTRIGGSQVNSAVGMTVTNNGTLYFTGGAGTGSYYIYSIANAATAPAVTTDPSVAASVANADLFTSLTDDGTHVYASVATARAVMLLNDDQSFTTLFVLATGWTPGQITYDEASNHLFVVARNNTLTSLYEYTTGGSYVKDYALAGNSILSGIVAVPAPVPEAASLAMVAAGAGALLLRRRKD